MKTLAKWTVADYHRLIEMGIFRDRSVELLAGDIVKMAPEGAIHAFVTEGGSQYLRSLFSGMAVVREAHPITLSDSEPQPDIAIVKPPRSRYRDRHPYPEDVFWLIEISQSTLDYDLKEKKISYAQGKIPEYWVVDVQDRQIHVFRQPEGNDYQVKLMVNEGTITPLAFPEIKVLWQGFWA